MEELDYYYEEMNANLGLWIQHRDEKALERYHTLADYVSKVMGNNY